MSCSAIGRRRGRTSDPDQPLAGLTKVPAVVWTVVLLVANLACLVVGLSTLAQMFFWKLSAGRGLGRGRFFTPDGRHLATVAQEGMIRPDHGAR